MSSGINLLTKKEDLSSREKKRLKILQITAGVILGITALFAVILIILYSQLKIAAIKKDQDSTIRNIASLREKSAKLTTIDERTKNIENILEKRLDLQKVISTIIEQLSGNAKVSGIDVSSEGINVRLSSTSLYDFKLFIDKMITLAQDKKVLKDLKIESLTRDVKNSRYNLIISSSSLYEQKIKP